jgi:hypothetical protein
MNPKAKTATAIFLLSIAILTSTAITYALGGFNQTATVTTTGSLTYTLDGVAFTGTAISWGPINPGQTLTKPLNVSNTKNEAVTPLLEVALPAGWTQTWSLNATAIAAKTDVAGVLTLTAPADALAGPVNIPTTLTP